MAPPICAISVSLNPAALGYLCACPISPKDGAETMIYLSWDS